MEAMREFVEGEVRHPLRLSLKILHVGELHTLRHHGIAAVVAQPARARMVFRARLHAGVFR